MQTVTFGPTLLTNDWKAIRLRKRWICLGLRLGGRGKFVYDDASGDQAKDL